MIHVAADQNLYKIKELISSNVHLHLYDPSKGIPDLTGTDALLVRTVTHLNAETLPHIPSCLKFVGTGSSGTDHLDNEYLESEGIELSSANGCNARSVAEYVMTALLLWREKFQPGTKFGKVGVIGVGKAGSAVTDLLSDFDIEYVTYDPPREKRDTDFTSATMEEVLSCDILTFHVPLTRKGDYPTYHWLDNDKLKDRNYKLIINASRGGVVDEQALLKAHKQGTIENYVLDVWEGEPDFKIKVARQAFIATPHIAGYSEQAKINATKMICDDMADHFDLSRSTPELKNISKAEDLAHIQYDLTKLITRLHPIMGYDAALRDLIGRPDKVFLFRNLRNEWPYRFEYSYLKIRKELLDEFPELRKLGITSSI
ncbi:4-phosphoerythronate dehydrogenase [Gracilimonas sp. Q87]|uniref:4-phosphoerythronate dehydrogenase n=1 Tax=Gracilimonas sp. Q87 TaxID=3384766 RepID=UPI003983F5B4